MPYFMVSIDTEGDNQWDTSKGITTENVKYLPRFQELCEKYGFKPVWLTNYEMALDDAFVDFFKRKQEMGKCEIGMHLHAWYTPPEYELKTKTVERSYLIEYPTDVMEKKIKTMTDLLEKRFGRRPVSHRSGRWVMDERYFSILAKFGYKVDCSVTPHVNWSDTIGATGMGGTDYSQYPEHAYFIREQLLEIPVTIRRMHFLDWSKINSPVSLLKVVKRYLVGTNQWLRFFDAHSSYGVKKLTKHLIAGQEDVLFMIHSSELMPAGSPSFMGEEEIEMLYIAMEEMMQLFKNAGYEGCTMEEYYDVTCARNDND